jgi:hypothetical protein
MRVPIHSFGIEAMLRPLLGLENQLTSPKTIEDSVRKSAQFSYGRIRS